MRRGHHLNGLSNMFFITIIINNIDQMYWCLSKKQQLKKSQYNRLYFKIQGYFQLFCQFNIMNFVSRSTCDASFLYSIQSEPRRFICTWANILRTCSMRNPCEQRAIHVSQGYVTLTARGPTLDVRFWRLMSVDVRFWRLKSVHALSE